MNFKEQIKNNKLYEIRHYLASHYTIAVVREYNDKHEKVPPFLHGISGGDTTGAIHSSFSDYDSAAAFLVKAKQDYPNKFTQELKIRAQYDPVTPKTVRGEHKTAVYLQNGKLLFEM